MMRVLLVSDHGAQYLAPAIPAMQRLGASFESIATDRLQTAPPRVLPRRFAKYHFGGAALGAFRQHIEAFAPDVMHVMGVRATLIKALTAARPYPSLGIVYERISAGGMNVLSPLDPVLFRSRRIDRVVMPSYAMLNNWMGSGYLRWLARPERCEVMHYPLDLPAAAGAAEKLALRARLGLDPEAFVVGTVCYIRPIKNLDFLAAVVAAVRTTRPVVLAVVGAESRDRDHMQAIRAAGGERLRLLGPIPQARDIMPAFDLYATPTRLPGESFGMAFAEAMAHGVPAVTMNYGGSAEICEHAISGFALPPLAAVWRQTIERVAEDATLQASLGAAARRRIAAHFSPEARAQDYIRLYATVREERRALAAAG